MVDNYFELNLPIALLDTNTSSISFHSSETQYTPLKVTDISQSSTVEFVEVSSTHIHPQL